MYEESVITPSDAKDSFYYVIPTAIESRFIDFEGNTARYEYARLDIMLEIINGYRSKKEQGVYFETEHYRFSREGMKEGILAKVTAITVEDE